MTALLLALLAADGGSMVETLTLSTREDIRKNDGRKVALVGTYEATRIEMKKQPDKPKVHARLLTPAGALVIGVYYTSEGRRPADELAKLDGKKVRVVGTLLFRPPTQTSEGKIPMATMLEPCISPVESVTLEP